MRQGDGSDFLDAGDPRRAEIGVVYVEAMDARQEVLTAINLLNIQGRKYVVLELTEARQVFQQPVDFDGLKQARRDLKAQLIVIAPSGSIPADLARSRHFDVFSSLANLKQEFSLFEQMGQPAQPQNAGGLKIPKILAFGSRKARPDRSQPSANSAASGPFAPNQPAQPTPRAPVMPFPVVPPTPLPPQPSAAISRTQGPLVAPGEQGSGKEGARPQQSQTLGKVPNAVSRTQGPLGAPGEKGPRPNAPTPMTMPTIPPTPRIVEQSPASFAPLPPTPVEPRQPTQVGGNQPVTPNGQDDDDALYAPSAQQPPLGEVPPTPIRKGRASKPIGTALPPGNQPIVFPSRGSTPLTKATPNTPTGGTLPTSQNTPAQEPGTGQPDTSIVSTKKPGTGNLGVGTKKPSTGHIGVGKPDARSGSTIRTSDKKASGASTHLHVEPDLTPGLLTPASNAPTSASGSATGKTGKKASGASTHLYVEPDLTPGLPTPASGSPTPAGTAPLASSPFVIPNQPPKSLPASPTPQATSQFAILGQLSKSVPAHTLPPASSPFAASPGGLQSTTSPATGAPSASPPASGTPGSFSTLGAGLAAGAALGGASNATSSGRLAPVGSPAGVGSRTPRTSGLTPFPSPPRQFRNNRRSQQRLLLLGILLVLLVVLIGSVLAATQGRGVANLLSGHVSATVTVTPISHMEQNNYIITGLPGGSIDNTRRQIPARIVTVTSPTQTGTGNATGSISARTASGTLRFINTNANSVTISSTDITGNDGVQVSFNGPITIPSNPPFIDVSAFAVNPGNGGNIRALDINKGCCTGGITVRNSSAFTGGQNAVPNSIIQQSDIDGAANPLVTTLTQSTQASLPKQVKENERVVDGTAKCSHTTTADQQAGNRAGNVHVSVTVTCQEEVYDAVAAQQMAVSLLLTQAQNDTAFNGQYAQYAQVGQIIPVVLSNNLQNGGQVNLEVQVQGLWAYQFTPQMQDNIKNKLVKLSLQNAQAVLHNWPGVATEKISLSSGTTMPATVNDITLTMQNIPGLQGIPTPGGTNASGTPTSGSGNGTPVPSPTALPTPAASPTLGGS